MGEAGGGGGARGARSLDHTGPANRATRGESCGQRGRGGGHHADDSLLGGLLADLPLARDVAAKAHRGVEAEAGVAVVLHLPEALHAVAHLGAGVKALGRPVGAGASPLAKRRWWGSPS